MTTIAILNTTISVVPGIFADARITVQGARHLARDNETKSYVGHEATAAICARVLGVSVPFNWEPFQGGMPAICFKLLGRPPEGRILTAEEIEAVGYEFRLLTPLGPIPKPGDRVLVRQRDVVCEGHVGTRGTRPVLYPNADRQPAGSLVVDVVPHGWADDGQGAAYPYPLADVRVLAR